MSRYDFTRHIYEQMEGLPDPSSNLALYGHDAVANEMAAAFASGRMHHAWLINGINGIGKATLAYRFANHIFHHSVKGDAPNTMFTPLPDDPDHRQLASGGHPNLIHLTRPWDSKTKSFKSTLPVDEIRRTNSFFGMTAAGGGWRVAIVDPAEDMNANAANALLKVLEEPPKKSLFLLVCNAPGKLLPTIRSRCREISVRPLKVDALASALAHLYGSDHKFRDNIHTIHALSEGSVRKAVQLIEGDGLKHYSAFLSLLEPTGNKPPNWPAIHGLGEQLALKSNAGSYALFLDLVMGFLARRVRGQDEPLCDPATMQQLNTVPLARWADVWDKLQQSFGLAESFNLDKKQVILSIFRHLLDVTR
jgi:DNA polymerase-3 subunit delta'